MIKKNLLLILITSSFIQSLGVELISIHNSGNPSVELYCEPVSSTYQKSFDENLYYYELKIFNHGEYPVHASIQNLPTIQVDESAYKNNHYAWYIPFNVLAAGVIAGSAGYSYLHESRDYSITLGTLIITAGIDLLWHQFDLSRKLNYTSLKADGARFEEKSYRKDEKQFYREKNPTKNSIVFALEKRITKLYYTYNAQTFNFYLES